MGILDAITGVNPNTNINTSSARSAGDTIKSTSKSFSGTDENELVSLLDESTNTSDLSSYDEKLKIAKTKIEQYELAIENYENTIEAKEKIIKRYEEQIEQKKQEKSSLETKLNSVEDSQENSGLKSQIRNKIAALNTAIASFNGYISTNTSLKNAAELMKSQAEFGKSTAEMEYNSISMLKQQAQLAALQNAAKANMASYTNTNSSTGTPVNTNANSGKASGGKTSQNGLNLVKKFEGCRLDAYRCPAGVATIGYGHTNGVQMGQSISQAQAEQYLREDLAEFEGYVTRYANEAGVNLTQNQFDALVSFSYNLGPGPLKSSGILTMIKQGNLQGAANKMKEYVHAGGKVLQGLVTRRNEEAALLMA